MLSTNFGRSYTVGMGQEQLMHLAYKVSEERANAIAATCQNQTQLGVILVDLVRREWRSCLRRLQSRDLTTRPPATGMGRRYSHRAVARPRRRSLYRRTRRSRRCHPIRRRHRESEPAVPLCWDPARGSRSAISQRREACQAIATPPAVVCTSCRGTSEAAQAREETDQAQLS